MKWRGFGIIAVVFLALEGLTTALVARELGAFHTLLWLLAAFVAGVRTIRHAGSGLRSGLRAAAQGGHAPLGVLWQGGRRFLAGALLIFPGVLSDLMALLLMLWPGPGTPPPATPPRDGGVIEGEFRRED